MKKSAAPPTAVSRRSRPTSLSVRAALLLASAAVLPPARAAAPVPPGADFAALQSGYLAAVTNDDFWTALSLADRAAALPGIPAGERVLALREAARMRATVGDPHAAEADLRRSLTLKPRDSAAELALAAVLRVDGEPDEALSGARRAERDAEGPLARAAAERLAGEIRLDLGDQGGAEKDLTRALADGGEDFDTLVAMVRVQRDWPATASLYADRMTAAAAKEPLWRRDAAYHLCADVRLQLEDARAAAADLRRALQLNPDHVETWEDLARLTRRYPAQLREPGPPPQLPPESAASGGSSPADELETLRRRIEKSRAEGRLPEAAGDAERFTEAVLDAPAWEQQDAYVLAARIWMELGDAGKTRHILERLLEVDYRSFEASRVTVGFPLPAHPEPNWDAAFSAARARPSEPENKQFFGSIKRGSLDIAAARRALGDRAGAETVLRKALVTLPDDADLRSALAAVRNDEGPSPR